MTEELTWEERCALVGEEVSAAERAFHQAWREYNLSAGFQQGVSVVDHERIRLMRHFFDAGRAHERPECY